MRRTDFFCETLRQAPFDADVAGHALLLRGAYIQALAAGIYSFLPLGERVKRKLEAILREEMEGVGAQEVLLPVVHPAELWQETGRWHDIGPELARFKSRAGRDMVLAMTHEEVVGDLLRKSVHSYRQLPVVLFQIQTKYRDEPRARGGLIRVREFVMKDAYSCHRSQADLDAYYPRLFEAYLRIFSRIGLDVLPVEADVGMMGGWMAHEFMYLSEIGEDQLVICDGCGYAANRQVAIFGKGPAVQEQEQPLREVHTPAMATIEALASFLDIPESRTAKAGFFMAGDRLVFAVVRGDMEVNEAKLTRAVSAHDLRPAGPEDIEGTGIVAGYASPIGVDNATVVVDDLVAHSTNLVAGANREHYHLLNVNYPRDYQADIVTDIASAYAGAPCARCGSPLHLSRGVEVGNTFKLGTRYSRALNATFLDDDGETKPIVMGSYGIGVGRLIACLAEAFRDERGLAWPIQTAPYHVYLVGLDLDDDDVRHRCETLYAALLREGTEVLYDDRRERAGVKFNDADLLGIPLRVTAGRRALAANVVELKGRGEAYAVRVPERAAVEHITAWIARQLPD